MIEHLVRPSVLKMKPYSSARDEFKGEASVFLDANENSFGSPVNFSVPLHRYPDPLQQSLKSKLGEIKGLPLQNIFLGNGSDEAIDVLFRVFCEPRMDNIIICPPTYGMYEVSANIHDVEVKSISLLPDFELDVEGILEQQNERSKLLFLCSPNNPTANSFNPDDMQLLVEKFNGIVVIDEAYINYARQSSCIRWLTEYENVIVLQTFSKAWGMAALRLGMAFGCELIIGWMNKVKPPYNINVATQELALLALDNLEWVNHHIMQTVAFRDELSALLKNIGIVKKVHPSDANFLLVEMDDADGVYGKLVEQGIIVRNRSKILLCENCLRITVGNEAENRRLLDALEHISKIK